MPVNNYSMQDDAARRGRETWYKGVKMRSRTEAGYAGWLDRQNPAPNWRYERGCFASEHGQWLSDFRVESSYVEVKSDDELQLKTGEQHSDLMERIRGYLCQMEIAWDSFPEAMLLLVFHRWDRLGGEPVASLAACGRASRTWYSSGILATLWPSGEAQFVERLTAERARLTGWLERQRKQGRLSIGEVGHDPPWHVSLGAWQGPHQVSRGQRMNQSLCNKPLGRALRRELRPERDDICGFCFRLAWDRMVSGW